ncbi:hypothetical protein Hanom_Chr03g00222211 [Helianthus anomalus]
MSLELKLNNFSCNSLNSLNGAYNQILTFVPGNQSSMRETPIECVGEKIFRR